MGALISRFVPQPSTEPSDEPRWAQDSEQARFESESKHLIVKELGFGSYGFVYASISDSDANVFAIDYDEAGEDPTKKRAVLDNMRASIRAVKLCSIDSYDQDPDLAEFQNEIGVLRYLNDHYLEQGGQQTVTRILEPEVGPNPRGWVLMELLTAGTLDDMQHLYWEVPQRLGSTIPADLLWHFIAQVTEALLFLHFGIVNGKKIPGHKLAAHRDLHGKNMMLRWPGNTCGNYPDIVIVDFGRAEILDPNEVDKAKINFMYRNQIDDAVRFALHLEIFLVNKADNSEQSLRRVVQGLADVQKSTKNQRLRLQLTRAMNVAKRRREAEYKDLPDAWIQYLSRPAVSDEELEAFLRQLKRWSI